MCVAEILKKDFDEALSEIDFSKAYDPYSRQFMKPLFIGMLLSAIKLTEDGVEEELDGAEKYLAMYEETGDAGYKEMAGDELKHAEMLMKRHAGGDTERTKEFEARKTEIQKAMARTRPAAVS